MNSKKVRPATTLFLAAVALVVIIGLPKVAANSTRSVVLEPSKVAYLSAPSSALRIAKLSDEPGLLILFGVALIGISSFLRRIF
jgi:hypothetical protein